MRRYLFVIGGIVISLLYSLFFVHFPQFDALNSTYITECTNRSPYGDPSFYEIIDSYNGSILNLSDQNHPAYKDPLSDAMAKIICANLGLKYTTPEEHNALLKQLKNDPTTSAVEAGIPNYRIKIYKTIFSPSLACFDTNIGVILFILLASFIIAKKYDKRKYQKDSKSS